MTPRHHDTATMDLAARLHRRIAVDLDQRISTSAGTAPLQTFIVALGKDGPRPFLPGARV
jgi:hypothetical protein